MKLVLLTCCLTGALYAETINVTFSSKPKGANISIEATPAGQTPGTMKLEAGTYRVRISKRGFETWDYKLKVDTDHANFVAVLRRVKAQTPPPPPEAELPVVETDNTAPSAQSPLTPEQYHAEREQQAIEQLGHANATHEVRYLVDSNHPAWLILRNQTGGIDQVRVSSLPWTYTFSGNQGQPLYVSAQKTTLAGWIECKIYLDGMLIKDAKSDLAFGIVFVNARIP